MRSKRNVLLTTSAAPTQSPFSTSEKRPPIGIGFLISVLRNGGHEVFFIDNYLQPSNFLKTDYLQRNKVDYVGIYANTICFRDTLRMLYELEYLRQSRKWKGKIVVGGPHTTVALDTIPDFVDYVVQGEGEKAIIDIVEDKVRERVIRYPSLENLDELPMVAWDYFIHSPYNWSVDWFREKPVFTMNTSRGCPFRCTFCSVGSIWGRRYTCFSAERIVSDIEYLIQNYGAKGIYFREDNFTLNRKRLIKFCDLLLGKKINIYWACESRVDSLDRELLKLMHRAGARAFYFGVESGSQKILDYLNKGITVDQIREIFKLCHEFDFKTAASIIVGVPDETENDILDTEKLLEDIKPEVIWRNVFVGIPNSELYHYAIQNGLYEFIDDRRLVYLKGHNERVARYYGNAWNASTPFSLDKPVISVVMAVYNGEKYIESSIKSILNQSYQDFEFIIVNDASTDHSAEILKKFNDPRIRVINNSENLGLTKSVNKGIQMAKGKYIARMDADDISLPHRLETQLNFLETNHDVALVGSFAYQIDENDKIVSLINLETENNNIKKCLETENCFIHGSILMLKEAFLRAGSYSEKFEYAQDFDLWIKISENFKVANIPEPLYSWRLTPDCISIAKREKQIYYRNLAMLDAKKRKQMKIANENRCVIKRDILDNQFKVIAIIAAHNEGDIVYHVIGDYIKQGIEAYLINHCSSDSTLEEASRWLGKGLIHIENFPQDSQFPKENESQYIWGDILKRKEELAAELDADWFIHADADEFRESPWPRLSLKEGIYVVDRLGYNAVDFELLNFRPVDNRFVDGTDVREALVYYEGAEEFNAKQIRAWKNLRIPADIESSGGHDITFSGRKVFPIKFILRHYPIRSQHHGQRKVFSERKKRFSQKEKEIGWHIQYDNITDENHNFIRKPEELTRYCGNEIRLKLLSSEAHRVLSKNWEREKAEPACNLVKLNERGYDTDKSASYLENYERYFSALVNRPVKILELGVFRGGSLYLWRDYFKKGLIVGLDINELKIDDSTGRIRVYHGPQQDLSLLDRIRRECAPDGFDVVIDDASHVAEYTRKSFWHLFGNHLKPGGLYAIEDWGTGYWGNFPDGKKYKPGENHFAGMVGFVKELVDECGMSDITHPLKGAGQTKVSSIQKMEICPGQVFIIKASIQITHPAYNQPTEKTYKKILSLINSGRKEEALNALQKLLESYPDYALAHNGLGALLYKKGDKEKARFHYEKAVSLNPGNPTFLKNLADFYYVELKRINDAASLYEKVLSILPQDVETLLTLGNIHVERGKFGDAKDCYMKALEIEPSNELASQMAKALEKRGQKAGDDPGEGYREVQSLIKSGDHDGAIDQLEKFLQVYPDYALAHNDLGFLYYEKGEKEKTLDRYEKAVELDPKNITFLKNLADFYYVELGRTEDALKIYHRILEKNPNDVETLFAFGHICTSLNRIDDALSFYEKVLQINPDHRRAKAATEEIFNKIRLDQAQGQKAAPEPGVSIIIPVNHQPKSFSRSIGTVLQNTEYLNFEIILVPDGPSKAIRDFVTSLGNKSIKQFIPPEDIQKTAGLNLAARSAIGDYFVFMDSRLILSKDWLPPLLKVASDSQNFGSVAPKVIDPPACIVEAGYSLSDGDGIKGAGEDEAIDCPEYSYFKETPSGSRYLMLVSKEAFVKSGGFDEKITDFGLAMIDLGITLRGKGKALFYQPSCIVGLTKEQDGDAADQGAVLLDERKIESLRPSIVKPVADVADVGATSRKKVLVFGIYLADKLNNVDDIVARLSTARKFDVIQHWVALGGTPSSQKVADVTVKTIMGKKPKYEIMNELISAEDLSPYEYLLMTDDDVVLPEGFLDEFITLQEGLKFVIAQPARTPNSHIDHPIVEQQGGILARETLFVEIGPVVSFHRSVYDFIFPFDLTSSMGWGYENVWSYLVRERKMKMGIIDNTPVDHSMRKPVENYDWNKVDQERREYLRRHNHLPLEACFTTLNVINYGGVR